LELGITAVELMPVHQFDGSSDSYWGYNTLNFFAPHQNYAYNKEPGGAITEFKSMVRELHKANIEVILDVVFNHTTEGDVRGPIYTFKGIDNSSYYLLNDNSSNPYSNYSGTGNTLRTDHPVVQRLIVDSLLFWVKEMRVDGFRFDLASVFSITSQPSKSLPPIFSHLSADNDFQQIRLIAEPWHWGGYQLGRSFPGDTWAQWNDQFRDCIRKFIKGDPGMLGPVITRIYGSDDYFPDNLNGSYHPYQSINFINCHDGFTLYDLIAYNERINSDGSNNNNSWNCGWEGDQNVPQDVMSLRMRQAKNLMVLLMLSNGTPMFCAGDEFLHTQYGHNNPYNADNDSIWLNWARLNIMKANYNFVSLLIKFRKAFNFISRSRFWKSDFVVTDADGNQLNYRDINQWCFSFNLKDSVNEGDQELYVMLNFHWHAKMFEVPSNGDWKQVINTYLGPGEDINLGNLSYLTSKNYLVGERSIVVLSR
jgi:isoamylase